MRNRLTMNRQGESTENSDRHVREIDLFALGRLFLHRRRWLIIVPLAITMATMAYLLLQPNVYTSHAIILPSGSGSTGVSALKELVGLGGGFNIQDENSSALFPVILASQRTRDAVLNHQYEFSHNDRSYALDLYQYFGIDNPDRARKALTAITDINTSKRTGEITVAATTEYPELSRQILSRYLAELEDYVIYKRQSTALASKRYLAEQIDKTGKELELAEDRLESYRKVNSDWAITGSPEILKDIGRLERDVDIKAGTYHYLQQQYEAAKLTAQQDTPVIRLLDGPTLPTMKSGPMRRRTILLTAFLTLFATASLIILIDQAKQYVEGKNEKSFHQLQTDFEKTFPASAGIVRRMAERARHRTSVSTDA